MERAGFLIAQGYYAGDGRASAHHASRQGIQHLYYRQVQRYIGGHAGEGGHPLLQQFLYPRSFGYVVSYDAQGFPAVAQYQTSTCLDIQKRTVFALVLPLAYGGAPLLQGALYVSIYTVFVMGRDVIEGQALELFLRVAECLLKGGIGPHDEPSFDVDQADVLGDLLDHRSVETLAFSEGFLRPPAPNGRPQSAGGGLERLHFGRRPLALGQTLVETDETPPLPFDKDRHYHYRQYVLGSQLGLFALRKVPRVAVHQLSLTQYLLPAAEAGGPVREGFEQGVVDLW